MSSSKNPPAKHREGSDVRPYEYQQSLAESGAPASSSDTGADSLKGSEPTHDELLARERRAWETGLQEGEARQKTRMDRAVDQERVAVVESLEQFARQGDEYFHQVEGEVIQLALSIARKILHREAQIDPLMLTGVARVALDRITGATSIRLRVHPANVPAWEQFLLQQTDLPVAPEVVADPKLNGSRIVLETSLGETELGLEEQLKEIERGLFDLMALRPRPHPGAPAEAVAALPHSVPHRSEEGSDAPSPAQGRIRAHSADPHPSSRATKQKKRARRKRKK